MYFRWNSFQRSLGTLKWILRNSLNVFFVSTLSHGVLGIRYWVLGTGYQVLVTRYWVPGRPEADLREAGGRLIGGSGGEPPSKKGSHVCFAECLSNAGIGSEA